MGSTAMLAAPLQKKTGCSCKPMQVHYQAASVDAPPASNSCARRCLSFGIVFSGLCIKYAAYERHWAQKVQHLAVALTAIMSGQGS